MRSALTAAVEGEVSTEGVTLITMTATDPFGNAGVGRKLRAIAPLLSAPEASKRVRR